MYKIVRAKPLEITDIAYGRLVQPFELAGLDDTIDSPAEILEFVVQIVNDQSNDSKNFDHVLLKTHSNMTPSEIYDHLEYKDDYIPKLYMVITDPETGHYSSIKAVTHYSQLQAFTTTANGKGYIDADYLGSKHMNEEKTNGR